MTGDTDHDGPEPSHLDPNFTSPSNGHQEHEPSLRERVLNFATMEPHFRTLTAIVIAQIIATSLLILLPDYLFGEITLKIAGIGQATVGTAHYIASVAFLLIGLTLFVAGLGRADLRGIATLLAFLFALYLIDLVLAWLPIELSLTIFVTIVLLFVACMIAAIFIRRAVLAKTKGAVSGNPLVLLLLLLVPWTSIGLYAVVSQPAFFYTMQFAIGAPFIVLYPFAALDWTEIADSLIKKIQQRLRLEERIKRLMIFSAVATILPVWLTAYAFIGQSQAVGSRLIVLCVLAGALLMLLRLAQFRGDWPTHLPWAPTAALVVVLVVLFQGVGRYVDWDLLSVVFTIAMSVVLCVCGRNPQWHGLAPTALLGTLIGFTSIYLALFSGSSPDFVSLIVMGATVASLYAAIVVAFTVGTDSEIRRGGIAALREPLQATLTLNASLVAIYVLAVVYGLILAGSERHVVEACVVALALMSELILSGHGVTNVQTDWFPRNSRLLMFFGFVTFTLAYTLSIVALHGEAEQLKAYKLFLNPESAVSTGLLLMAPALVWTLFILRMGRWLAGQRTASRVIAPTTAQVPVG